MSKASEWASRAQTEGMTWKARHGSQRAEVTPSGDLRLWGLADYHPEDALGLADFVYGVFLDAPVRPPDAPDDDECPF